MATAHAVQTLQPHHLKTIENSKTLFLMRPEVQALLLGGSIAHGYANPDSDVDVLIVLSDAAYQAQALRDELQFFSRELADYPGGYVDGKYLGVDFLHQVAQRGSEPARFAFDGAQVLFSRLEGLDGLLKRITRYPVEEKEARLKRFYAQLEAWHWYCGEALKRQDRYLLGVAVSKLLLFGGRMLLAHNERLYPYHKWFLRVLFSVPEKPPGLEEKVQALLEDANKKTITDFYELLQGYRDWEKPASAWPNHFMLETEQGWLHGALPVADL